MAVLDETSKKSVLTELVAFAPSNAIEQGSLLLES